MTRTKQERPDSVDTNCSEGAAPLAGVQKKQDEAQKSGELAGEFTAVDGPTQPQEMELSAEVGIIFLRENRLWIDSIPVNEAADYGALKTHEKGHPDYWEELQRRGVVPGDVEYDEVPRGRVTADPRQGTFLLLLDRCILRRIDFIVSIRKTMHLPAGAATEVGSDSHYVCPGCRPAQESEDDDW